MKWEVGYANPIEQTMRTCDFNNENCYDAKTVPVIFDISQNQGYLTGGQNLTIHGFGFNHKDIDIKVDGQSCAVTRFQEHQVDCTVAPKAEISVIDTPQVGQYGIRRKFFDYSKAEKEKDGFTPWEFIWSERWKKLTPLYEALNTNLESHRNVGDYLTHQFKGWFIPPATTKYRFYHSCDDICKLVMGDKPGSNDNVVKKMAPAMIA